MVPYVEGCIAALGDREGWGDPDTIDYALGGVADMGAEGWRGGVGLEHCFFEFKGDEGAVDR